MKKLSIDGSGYYMSCMTLFNLIYFIKMIIDGLFFPENINWKSWIYYIDFFTFCTSIILFLMGVIFTIIIIKRDDSIQTQNTLGREVTVSELKDLTGQNYFTNYSLLVLTGLSLPTNKNVYSLILYFLVLITLGIVYIKKDLIYINPAMALFNFSVYACRNKQDKRSYIFVVRKCKLENGDTVSYADVGKKIIRINNTKAVKKQTK